MKSKTYLHKEINQMNIALDNITIEIKQIVLDTEKVVGNIADSELKKIAFDRILERLLQIGLPKTAEETKKVEFLKTKVEKDSLPKPGPKTWIRELVDDDFFNAPRTNGHIRMALDERGHILEATDLTSPLDSLVKDKVLRRKKMPAEEGGKDQVHWVNW
jgi:hypothetical protein